MNINVAITINISIKIITSMKEPKIPKRLVNEVDIKVIFVKLK